jgi:hypothetical protein
MTQTRDIQSDTAHWFSWPCSAALSCVLVNWLEASTTRCPYLVRPLRSCRFRPWIFLTMPSLEHVRWCGSECKSSWTILCTVSLRFEFTYISATSLPELNIQVDTSSPQALVGDFSISRCFHIEFRRGRNGCCPIYRIVRRWQ